MTLTPGTRLGPYEVGAQIGAGGMGEVYRATDTKLKRDVAVKVLPASLAGDPERLARFQREAEVLATLNHQNIAHIYGIEDADGITALVTELVEGPTLADRIAQGAIPVDEALPIAKQIAEALEKAHEQGIIHRDLKPANVKVRPDGTVKVLAFETSSPEVAHSLTVAGPRWRRAAPLAALTAVFAAIVVALVSRPEPVPEVTRFQIHAPAGSTLPLGTPAPSPDGRALAYIIEDADGIRRLHVQPMDRLETRALPGTEGAVHPFWSLDGREIAFATIRDRQLKVINVEVGAPRALGPVVGPWHGTWNQFGAILAIGANDVRRVSPEGGEMTPVAEPDATGRETDVSYPFFLSDGQRYLVLVRTDGRPSIQLATLGSATRSLILDNVASAPLLSSTPTGKSYLLVLRGTDVMAYAFDEAAGATRGQPVVLAYQSSGGSLVRQLAWVDRLGADVDTLPSYASVQEPQLSPDGLFVAGSRFGTAGSRDVWVIDLRRRSPTRVTFSGFAMNAVWSPDSSRLAFRRARLGGPPGLYVMDKDGTNERQLRATDGRVTSWSADARYILYDEDGKLWMIPATGDDPPIPVGSPNGQSRLGVFSPDAKYIAYVSDELGRPEVWVQAMPPAIQRVKVSISGGTAPRWRGDGRELYFLNADAVWAVDMTNVFSPEPPRELFRTTGRALEGIWDVDRVGSRFLLPARRSDDSPITVVLNWWVDLDARLNPAP